MKLSCICRIGEARRDEDLAAAAARRALEIPPARCRAYALGYSWRQTAERFLSYLAPWS